MWRRLRLVWEAFELVFWIISATIMICIVVVALLWRVMQAMQSED